MGNNHDTKATGLGRQAPVTLPEILTPRQLEVLALLCEGLPNKLIGRRLDIASGTVKVHVVQILRALNVSSRLQAVIAARNLRLVDASYNSPPIQAIASVLSQANVQHHPSGSKGMARQLAEASNRSMATA